MVVRAKKEVPNPCPEKESLRARELISCEHASEVESLFGLLSNDTRLRILHEIVRQGEVCGVDLAEALEMKPQAISNQLQRLLDRKIVAARRDGNNVYYRIVDNCVLILLDRAWCLIEEIDRRVSL